MIDYKEYHSGGQTTYVIKCGPKDIEIKILGNTLYNAKVNGINGTFFDTPRPWLEKSCWGLAVNDGKPIGENSHTTDYNDRKRGVVAWDGHKLYAKRINNYKEIPSMIWGISGVLLKPYYSRWKEGYFADVYRTTNHTVIGFDKENNIYLIVRTKSSMWRLLRTCRNLGIIGAVSLDGGGSSQLNFNDEGLKSNRRINSAIVLK